MAPAHVAMASARQTPAAMMAADELSMLQAMSDSFWKQKRARLKADLAAQLLELDEFEAREKALQEVSGTGSLSGGSDVKALEAALEAERQRSAQLEAQLQKQALEAELNIQKVSAYWISKLDQAKGKELAAAPAAPALGASSAAPAADLVAGVAKEFLEPELSLRELRSRLLSRGLSTVGIKSELRFRLEQAQLLDRQQFKSWDSEKLAWN